MAKVPREPNAKESRITEEAVPTPAPNESQVNEQDNAPASPDAAPPDRLIDKGESS